MSAHSADPLGLFLRAVAFAAEKHRLQRRLDVEASAYINHPIALANVLKNEGGISDPIVLCAALLHDTIEDTETTYEELREEFGPEIADVVAEVTDDKTMKKEARKRAQVEHAHLKSPRAKLVKLADKICNLRDMVERPPAEWSLGRKQEYFDWAKSVIDRLRGSHGTLERLFDEAYARRPR